MASILITRTVAGMSTREIVVYLRQAQWSDGWKHEMRAELARRSSMAGVSTT